MARKTLARDNYVQTHPVIEDLARQHNIGHTDALSMLRGSAQSNPKAKAALAEIEKADTEKKFAVKKENDECAAKLGLTMDQIRDLVGKIAADEHLHSWFTSRLNWTAGQSRPLGHDE